MIKINFGPYSETVYDGISFHALSTDYDVLHNHEGYEFTTVLEGSYVNTINGKQIMMKAGKATLLGPNDEHSLKINEPNSLHLNVLVSIEKFQKICNSISPVLLDYFDKHHPLVTNFDSQTTFKILSLMDSIKIVSETSASIISSLIINTIVEAFVSDFLLNSTTSYPDSFKRVLIECNSPKNLSWKSTDVAKYAHYSQTHINRLFKKYLNTSVVDYLNKIKMDSARIMLLSTSYSVAEISQLLGYSSKSYFNKMFSQTYHLTPYQFKLKYYEKNS